MVWLGWLTRSVPLLLLLALLGVLTVIPVAAGHILGPPGLLLYWLGIWWLGRMWFRNFLTVCNYASPRSYASSITPCLLRGAWNGHMLS